VRTFGAFPFASMILPLQSAELRKHSAVRLNNCYQRLPDHSGPLVNLASVPQSSAIQGEVVDPPYPSPRKNLGKMV